jgi:hypothetical protein
MRKTLRLRNINFNGFGTGLVGIRITGGGVVGGGAVFIEDCLIDGNFGGAAIGISDERTGGGKLFVSNTTIRNTGSIGVRINPGGGTTAEQRIDAMLDRMLVENSSFGSTFGNDVRVMIARSVFSGHGQAGIAAGGSTF